MQITLFHLPTGNVWQSALPHSAVDSCLLGSAPQPVPGGAQPVPTLICCFHMFGKVGVNNCRANRFLARSQSGFCEFFSKSKVAIQEQKDKRNICFPGTNTSLLTSSALQAECWSLFSGGSTRALCSTACSASCSGQEGGARGEDLVPSLCI